MNNYNISIPKNFLPKLEKNDIKLIISKFNTLNTEFLLCILDNIIVQNEKYLLFVIQRGLETLKHCFKMILMYTKNLDLTLYHCKKAYCYYVEFIGQIGDDNNSYDGNVSRQQYAPVAILEEEEEANNVPAGNDLEDKVEEEAKLSSLFKRHSSSCKCLSLKEINKKNKNE